MATLNFVPSLFQLNKCCARERECPQKQWVKKANINLTQCLFLGCFFDEPNRDWNWTSNKRCSMMLLQNLAEPGWVEIPCTKELLCNIFCFIKNNSTFPENKSLLSLTVCSKFEILHFEHCLIFSYFHGNNTVPIYDGKAKHFEPIALEKITLLKPIFEAVQVVSKFPSVVAPQSYKNGTITVITYNRYLHIHEFSEDVLPLSEATGFQIFKSKKLRVPISGNVFQCKLKSYISSRFLCDGKGDCPNDSSDEDKCVCSHFGETLHSESTICRKSVDQHTSKKTCSPLLYQTMKGCCISYAAVDTVAESVVLSTEQEKFQNCSGNTIKDKWYRNIQACSKDQEGKTFLRQAMEDRNYICAEPYKLQCQIGCPQCFNIIEVCLYKLGQHTEMIPCKNGGHLQKCTTFQCNALFKCKQSYCVSWSSVCDGKWDCPSGQDEAFLPVCGGQGSRCSLMFSCHKTSQCIHIGNTCDGAVDCLFGDDENHCFLKEFVCPMSCACHLLAIWCRRNIFCLSLNISSFVYVFVQDVELFSRKIHLTKGVLFLVLNKNFLQDHCQVILSEKLLLLNFGYNTITAVQKQCLQAKELKWLLLNNNKITMLTKNSFQHTPDLQLLNLSGNPFSSARKHSFLGLKHLLFLSVKSITFKHVDPDLVHNVYSLKLIEATTYHICCTASVEAKCNVFRPWYISCSNLIPKTHMKVVCVVVSILILFLSLISVTVHYHSNSLSRSFVFNILCTNYNDMLCCVYLGVVWAVDTYYHSNFALYEAEWRSGSVCFMVFSIILWSTIQGQLLLFILSLSRLMVVKNPFATAFKSKRFTAKIMIAVFSVSLFSSIVVTFATKVTSNSLPLSLCMPFLDPSGGIDAIRKITWATIVLQLVTTGAVVCINFQLVTLVLRSEKRMESHKTSSHAKTNKGLFMQLVLLTISNFLSWLPPSIVYILAMFLKRYPTDLVVWTFVCLTPLNSVLNPIVFLFGFIKPEMFLKLKLLKNRSVDIEVI